jgi:hypothetical protein
MALRKPLARQLAGWLILLLLCAQWATASYACPRAGAPSAAASMAGMPDCDGMPAAAMDPDAPLLCKAHCEQGSQTVQPLATDLPAPAAIVWAVLDWHVRALAAAPARHAGVPSHTPPDRAGAPPIYLALRVLRN